MYQRCVKGEKCRFYRCPRVFAATFYAKLARSNEHNAYEYKYFEGWKKQKYRKKFDKIHNIRDKRKTTNDVVIAVQKQTQKRTSRSTARSGSCVGHLKGQPRVTQKMGKRESTFFTTCDPRRLCSMLDMKCWLYVPTSACCTENSNIVSWNRQNWPGLSFVGARVGYDRTARTHRCTKTTTDTERYIRIYSIYICIHSIGTMRYFEMHSSCQPCV